MAKYKAAKEVTYMLSTIMILIGVILILLSKISNIGGTLRGILEFIGITLLGVFAVSLVYQRFVAEKHFEDFKTLLTSQLKEMDLIQSQCIKLGISEIFETRTAYQAKYPLITIIEQSPDNANITCIARSLFHLMNKTGEIKKGLENGLTFELACIDPNLVTHTLEEVSFLYKSDIESALRELRNLLSWAVTTKPKGAIQLRYHHADSLDTVFIFTSEDGGEKLVWDLSFGRDLTQKRVMILDTSEGSLGNDLKNRYTSILKDPATSIQIQYSKGDIKHDGFGWFT